MKMFISKNALSEGIQEAEGEILSNRKGVKYFEGKLDRAGKRDSKRIYKEGEYHETLEDANLDAQRRVLVKIVSHEKAIEALKKLQFVTSNIVA